MSGYSTRQAERLLGLPSSTLRHWERVVSIVEPRKDAWGRRVYSRSDLQLLLRLRHLAQGRGLGLARGAELLLCELSGPRPGSRALIAEIRGELIGLYFESIASAARRDAVLRRHIH